MTSINTDVSSTEEADHLVAQLTTPGIHNDDVMKVYSTWAQNYDRDETNMGYLPSMRMVAEKAAEYLTPHKHGNILDAAAGTGLVGLQLKDLGFTNVDALDGSKEMLDKAKEKSIYKKLIHSLMGKEHKLPIETGTYEGVTVNGGHAPGHLDGGCYEELIRVTKPGGFIIIGFKEHYLNNEKFRESTEGTAYDLEKKGAWRIKERNVRENYMGSFSGVIFVFEVLKHV